MRNIFKKAREFECCGCGLKFKLQKIINEEFAPNDQNYEIIQKDYLDENGNYNSCLDKDLDQNCAEQIYCPRCGDDEAFPTEKQYKIDESD